MVSKNVQKTIIPDYLYYYQIKNKISFRNKQLSEKYGCQNKNIKEFSRFYNFNEDV